ncbi:TPA: hypothetical protein REU88_002786, partial [Listeria monocytogenes]|nr:hypothetical protein [Listeria monocytogenes]
MAEQESLALFNDTPEELFMKGTMLSTIFYNAENLFSVVRILVKETNADWDEKDIIVTGF